MSKNTVKASVKYDDASFVRACVSIKTRGAKLDNEIQELGLAALKQVDQGNMNWINTLALALPKSARTVAFKAWVLACGKCVLNEDKASAKAVPFRFAKDKVTLLELAAEKPWYKHAKDTEAPVFDAQKAVDSLLTRLKGNVSLTAEQEKAIAGHTAAIKALLSQPQGQSATAEA